MWGLTKHSSGYQNKVIIPEIRVVMDNLHVVPAVKKLFDSHHFEWMGQPQGSCRVLITQEFYVVYAATLLNSFTKETSRKTKK